MNFDNIKNKLVGSKDQVEKGLGKAGDMAKAKFGHDKEVDKGVDAANHYLDNESLKSHGTPATPTSPPTVVDPDHV